VSTDDQIGTQFSQPDPRGWLVFDHLGHELTLREESTQSADSERCSERFSQRPLKRPATDTERLLLQHIGFTDLPDDLTTVVTYPTTGVRNRRWPQLETEENTHDHD
jgi:hypothetical protein